MNLDTTDVPITGVTLNVVTVPKTEAYQRESAAGRTRRTRTLTEAEKQRAKQKAQLEASKQRRRGGRRGAE